MKKGTSIKDMSILLGLEYNNDTMTIIVYMYTHL